MKYEAFVLEESSMPYSLGSFESIELAERKIEFTKSQQTPTTVPLPIWYWWEEKEQDETLA